ncbi:hypothetical protein [Nitrosophilus labii]|uniref:hypothetical protein n=1 Tax=Nitrosophilus labii TaxID=2706014 RepID=UPI001656C4F1|nr:hypothetical protein [Nitrosophilus labii]
MKNNIELSTSGIKFSYRRFLADTSIGFAIILLFLSQYPNYMEHNFMIMFFILASTPVGILVNISSWILLGFFQTRVTKDVVLSIKNGKLWSIEKYLLLGTDEHFQIKDTIEFYKLNEENFYKIVKLIEHFLSVHCPQKIGYYQDIVGMRIFYRNVSLLLMIIPFIVKLNLIQIGIIISMSLFFLIANSIITIYGVFYLLQVFKMLFLRDKLDSKIDYKEIISTIKEFNGCD